MSKFTTMAVASHSISVRAMEEASRRGRRTADIDDMLVALALDAQTAGQVLRSLGVTMDAVRDAVSAQHTDMLADVGIVADTAESGRITFHQTAASYEWNQRSLEVMKRAGEAGKSGDAVALLRELLDEPSGLIASILARLDLSSAEVRARLDEAARIPEHQPGADSDPNVRSGASDVFVPAPAADVWSFLVDPARIPEWDSALGTIDIEDPAAETTVAPALGSTWEARSLTERPYDGKKLKVNADVLRQRVELTALSPESTIAWRFTYPDAVNANARHVRFDLSPAAGGTQLRIVFRWERDPNRRLPRLRFLLRPIHRFIVWMMLSQIGAGVSRAFR